MTMYSVLRLTTVLGMLSVAVLVGVLAALAIAAPVEQSLVGYPAGEDLYALLSPICHQYPTRSLWVLDRPMALCARCFAMYLSFAVSVPTLLWARHRRIFDPTPVSLLLVILLLLPLIVDGTLQALGYYESLNIIRVATGTAFGLAGSVLALKVQAFLSSTWKEGNTCYAKSP